MEQIANNKQIDQQRQDAFFRATLDKDSAYMNANLHDDFVFISPRAVVMRKPAFLTDFIGNAAIQMDVFSPAESSTTLVGATAVFSGIADAKFRDKDPFKVYYSMTFVHQEADWKLLAMQETFIP